MSTKKSNKEGKLHFAAVAGLFAASGSFFGKLAGSPELIIEFSTCMPVYFHLQEGSVWPLQLVCLVLMIAGNALVWTFFVRALQGSKSSLPATVLSSATNYVTSALLGRLVFGEMSGLLWLAGTSLVVAGMALVVRSKTTKLD